MDRITADASSAISVSFYNDLEGLLDPDGNAVSVSVKNGAGTIVVASTPATRSSQGVYKLTVDLSTLDTYTATWVATFTGNSQTVTTQFEVVGAEVFTLSELRASDRALSDNPGITRYTTELLRAARTAAVERLERAMGVALTPRGRRATLSGDGTNLLLVPDLELITLYSCSVDSVAITPTTIAAHEWGGLVHPDSVWAIGVRNISVHYAHGFPAPPAPVKRAALLLAVDYLIPSNLPARATVQSTDLGAFRLSVAGREGPTGIPEVDAVVEAFGRNRPAVGSTPAIG